MHEATLVAAAKSDPDAFARLYDLTLPEVYRYALAQTRDHARAEDATAETYRRALTAIAHWEDRGQSINAWLVVICRNVIRDSRRRGGRELPLADHDVRSDEWPGEDATRAEAACVVRRLVARLTAPQRRVVVLRYGHELSCREVAERMGTTEAAVKQLSYRAVSRLRELMKEVGYDPRA